ncbi:MAG: hypothetical protein A3F83_11335 [Candidatus Glassbacteria bacterium RIFCSPLOWO2_12_FULL_58_11]|uniref:L,D-TPase catalytic domain-containing protein n=2 Tax=Candidatus Glassiibacteriota TaxID=1817805 RepID=A0A1F5YMX6_9BACT|nr:MAG: hypothetical protein A2Z86_06910 [Candidatus Glassbacteria bacterium GWA2_58_10]OGG01548.1 MAG: hypothetical protein A3F83_11335 [Candidatus Glassbacteria bacterium RIFCSPLOWO2_12_FULL_58_11]
MGDGASQYALLVDKQSQMLYLYSSTPDGPHLDKQFRCTTGKNNNGAKVREGDKKTPNGVYFFRSILEDGQLPSKYGVRAFPMDYPNDYDRLDRKTGYGIWLHAVDEDQRVSNSFDTEGCVVVTNKDIMEISSYIRLNSTPIIVDDSIIRAPAASLEEGKKEVLAFIDTWVKSWAGKDLDRYMDCYDERFYGYGRSKEEQRRYKENLNRAYKKIRIKLSDYQIFGYHDYIVASFVQDYRSDRFHSTGRKKLYLTRTENGPKILSERINR